MLNLSGNALDGLEERLVNWSVVGKFDLSGNAWNCDCRLGWMHRVGADIDSLATVKYV